MTDPTEDTPAEILRTRLRRDLRAAMKAQRRDEMAALRTLIAAIDNAEAAETPSLASPPDASEHVAGARRGIGTADTARRSLSDGDLQRIVEAELWERDAQADRLELLGRTDDSTHLRTQAEVLARYRSSES